MHGNTAACLRVIWNGVTVGSKKGEMTTRFDGGSEGREAMEYLNKVACAHFDPPDLLKLNYFDPRTLARAAAEAAGSLRCGR